MTETKPDRFAATCDYFDRRIEMLEARIVAQAGTILDMSSQLEAMASRLERAVEAVEAVAELPQQRAVPRDPGPGAA